MKILSFCYKREGNKSANEILVLEKLRLCTALNAISFGGLTEWFKVKKSDISVCVLNKNQKRREAKGYLHKCLAQYYQFNEVSKVCFVNKVW